MKTPLRYIQPKYLVITALLWSGMTTAIAQSNANVTIRGSNMTLETILKNIQQQTGVDFSYNAKTIPSNQTLSFFVVDLPLHKTMERLCNKIGITFEKIDNQVILYTIPEEEKPSTAFFSLNGYIYDQETGETLIGATVYVPGTTFGTITNAFGYYSLQLPPGKYQVQYQYVGYNAKSKPIQVSNNERQNVKLTIAAIELPNVVVDETINTALKNPHLDHMDLPPNEWQNMPEFGGESGLVKGLQTLPGVSMHSDGSAFFYTRGGNRDQNLIIVDDAPIYNPSHLFGFYSIVIPDFTKSVEVYKSDIPARLGDRLSAIVSIRTKDGNSNRINFSGALNPLINRFTLESPVFKKRGSLFTSFRRTNFDWLYKSQTPTADLYFSDFSFKWNHKLNNNDRLYFTMISSIDNFTTEPENGNPNSGIRWANFGATLRWNHLFNPRLFANTILYTGNYAYRMHIDPNYWQSGLSSLSLKTDFTHYLNPALQTNFGLEIQGYFVDPGRFSLDSTLAILPQITPNYAGKLALYYQANWNVHEKWTVNAGLRFVNWTNQGPITYYGYNDHYEVIDTFQVDDEPYHRYFRLDPRVSIQYQVTANSQLKLSYGIYHQYLQLISNSTAPFTSMEIWLPASPNIQPQMAQQWTLNYFQRIPKSKLETSFALFYKDFDHQIDYKNHATTIFNPFLEGELRFGTMTAYGLECQIKKDWGPITGRLSYTFSRTFRQTNDLNGGRRYAAFQDRPHDFTLLWNAKLGKRWYLSSVYTFFSGSRFSSPTSFYRFNDQNIPIYEEKNNDRLPAYQRLDVALKFLLNRKQTAKYQHSLTFSVYNALLNKNVININFNKIASDGPRPLVKTNLLSEIPLQPSQIDLIRFFPSLTYKFNLGAHEK